jgi:hypothetical protein
MEEKNIARLEKLYGKPLLIKPHHSYDDWQFSGSNWPYYSAEQFISPPTTLASGMVLGGYYYGHSALKTYPCIPEIRIVNNFYTKSATSMQLQTCVRVQALDYQTYYWAKNCYDFDLTCLVATFYRVQNYQRYLIKSAPVTPNLPINTWNKYRFSIWDLPNHQAPTSLAYRAEVWQTDQWKTVIEGTATPNLWYDSSVNYFNIFLRGMTSYDTRTLFIDDTEIWIPAT